MNDEPATVYYNEFPNPIKRVDWCVWSSLFIFFVCPTYPMQLLMPMTLAQLEHVPKCRLLKGVEPIIT